MAVEGAPACARTQIYTCEGVQWLWKVPLHARTHAHARAHTRTRAHARTCTRTRAHAQTHTHTHVNTHTCAQQYTNGRGGVLGDEMGLGKTVQVSCFLNALMAKAGTSADKSRSFPMPEGDCRQALVVVPLTTLSKSVRSVKCHVPSAMSQVPSPKSQVPSPKSQVPSPVCHVPCAKCHVPCAKCQVGPRPVVVVPKTRASALLTYLPTYLLADLPTYLLTLLADVLTHLK